jgi:tetratricopeptide (TPR) repeat protein
VIVFQNLGIDSLPYWHYAVVIGFDLNKKTISLHTGLSENRQVPMAVFENTWRRSDYWVLAPLPAGKISVDMDPLTYLQAALDVLNTGDQLVAIKALKLAHKTWPNNWLASFSLANHYYDANLTESISWYEAALARDNNQLAIWNNYLYALDKTGCYEQARSALACMTNSKDVNNDFSVSIIEMTEKLKTRPQGSSRQCHSINCIN